MSDNVKLNSEIDRLLKQKQDDYGHFYHTSYVMVGIMEQYLSIHNNQDIKIPIKFFGLVMIFLKLWRVMQSDSYKKDSFDELLTAFKNKNLSPRLKKLKKRMLIKSTIKKKPVANYA